MSDLATPVSTLRIVTAAPGITAPVASVTVPRMSPEFVFCARPNPAMQENNRITDSTLSMKRYLASHAACLNPGGGGKNVDPCISLLLFVGVLRSGALVEERTYDPMLA